MNLETREEKITLQKYQAFLPSSQKIPAQIEIIIAISMDSFSS